MATRELQLGADDAITGEKRDQLVTKEMRIHPLSACPVTAFLTASAFIVATLMNFDDQNR